MRFQTASVKITFALLLTAFVSGLALKCFAVQWVEVSIGNSTGSITYIDMASLFLGQDGHIFAWHKKVHKNEKNIPSETVMIGKKKVWFTKYLNAYDCPSRMMSDIYQWTDYGLNEAILNNGTNNYPPWTVVIPESVGETQLQFVCDAWAIKQQAMQPQRVDGDPQQGFSSIDETRWLKVTEDAQSRTYVDKTTIKPDYDYRGSVTGYAYWLKYLTTDYKESKPIQGRVDCIQRKMDWKAIPPESWQEKVFLFLCQPKTSG